MPSFISKGGEWFPAKERAMVDPANSKSNPQPGVEAYIHEGPDREAVAWIAQEHGVKPEEVIAKNLATGMKVADDPQIMQLARDRGMTLEAYLEANKPLPQQVKEQEVAHAKVVTHSAPAPKASVQSTKGGFYDENSDPVQEFNKKR